MMEKEVWEWDNKDQTEIPRWEEATNQKRIMISVSIYL